MSLTWRLYRDGGLIKLFPFAVIAKIAPYRLATGTLPLLTTGTLNRWIAPGNANSLNCRAVRFKAMGTILPQARVWQPIPALVPDAKYILFFANPHYDICYRNDFKDLYLILTGHSS